ncbi:putative rSAM-modified RiPP, XyeA family [Erwinia sp. E602]|uniref:XyeA family cyclophane-containing RiPP triceptide n=1 Tax=Erwinia sp. E602 TaxID=2675378 RepID=UPI001BA989D7|nr:XyeA family cyclophane-containing RiPP triceptide [Erwinia sp. E602]QUG74970.1 putative rSAM-modified RiPP, XyeA family [Erwinia sp. E602]
MKTLKREIERNNCQLTDVDVVTKKAERKALVDGLLDTVSGGWVNAFANWPKRF